MTDRVLTVAIGSLGAIGRRVATGVVANPRFQLSAVSALDHAKAQDYLRGINSCARVTSLGELAELADIVVECAPAPVFREIAQPAVKAGRILVPATVSGLLAYGDLMDLAGETGARIIVPSGAIGGLDAVRAVAFGRIDSVKLVTRKSPRGLAGAPYLVDTGFDPDAVKAPTCVFKGNTFEAARAFPANVNVAVALALAGAGPERTLVEIWADPDAIHNTHMITVEADAARFDLTIEVLPSPDNPKSSTLTPLSILAALESLISPVRAGS